MMSFCNTASYSDNMGMMTLNTRFYFFEWLFSLVVFRGMSTQQSWLQMQATQAWRLLLRGNGLGPRPVNRCSGYDR